MLAKLSTFFDSGQDPTSPSLLYAQVPQDEEAPTSSSSDDYSSTSTDDDSEYSSSASSSGHDSDDPRSSASGAITHHGIEIIDVLDRKGGVYIVRHARLKPFILANKNTALLEAVQATSRESLKRAHALRPLWMPFSALAHRKHWPGVSKHILQAVLLHELREAHGNGTLKHRVADAVDEDLRQRKGQLSSTLPIKSGSGPITEWTSVAAVGVNHRRLNHETPAEIIVPVPPAEDDSGVDKELKSRKAKQKEHQRRTALAQNLDVKKKRWEALSPEKKALLYERYQRTHTGKRRVMQTGGTMGDGFIEEAVPDQHELPVFFREIIEAIQDSDSESDDPGVRKREQRFQSRMARRLAKRAEVLMAPLALAYGEKLEHLVTWYVRAILKMGVITQWYYVDLVAGTACSSMTQAPGDGDDTVMRDISLV